jgi:uncharacterized Rmd1/YagE family protein
VNDLTVNTPTALGARTERPPIAAGEFGHSVRVVARCVGARIVSGESIDFQKVGHSPARVVVGQGVVFVFRTGVLVAINVDTPAFESLRQQLAPLIREANRVDEFEEVTLIIDTSLPEGIDGRGNINLHAASAERLELVAHVMAKTTVLALYERGVAEVFEQVEHIAQQLRSGVMPRTSRGLLSHIGDALITQIGMVGRAEVTEKPDLAWNDAAIDTLYERLAKEFELAERDRILARKLALISEVAERHLDLLNSRRSLRVEWYIVALILFEICLGLYDRIT